MSFITDSSIPKWQQHFGPWFEELKNLGTYLVLFRLTKSRCQYCCQAPTSQWIRCSFHSVAPGSNARNLPRLWLINSQTLVQLWFVMKTENNLSIPWFLLSISWALTGDKMASHVFVPQCQNFKSNILLKRQKIYEQNGGQKRDGLEESEQSVHREVVHWRQSVHLWRLLGVGPVWQPKLGPDFKTLKNYNSAV